MLVAVGLPNLRAAEDTNSAAVADRIDQFIEAGYAANQVEPHPEISDQVFVRRIYLDLAGRIPTREESGAFFADKSANKRSQLIDQLLDSEAYVHHFFNYWSDLLRAKTQIAGNGNSISAGMAYLEWIKDALRDNMPYDEMARALIAADGQSWNNGAVGYYLRDYGMPLDNLALTSQVFLGTQIVCAQCHNHPFDEWTQMDYYKMAAFTYGVLTTNDSENAREAALLYNRQQRGKGSGKTKRNANGKNKNARQKPVANNDADGSAAAMSMSTMGGSYDAREMRKAISEILFPVRFNSVRHTERMPHLPQDYQYDNAKPKAVVWPETPFGPKLAFDQTQKDELDVHPSVAFAAWLTSPENPRFTKVIVNRLWKKVMGYGLIEPADELRAESVASNPELLAFLEQRFIAFDYDMKRFLRALYRTRTYQREAHTEDVTPGLPYYFPGPLLRRMSAEQIWDSVVAMIVEEPDARSLGAELARERTLTKTEWIARAIYDLSPQELLDGALEIAAVQRRLSAEIQQTQVALAAAREDGDAETINAAQRAVAGIRRQLQEHVAERIYRRGLEQKIELVSSRGAAAIGAAKDEGEAEFLTELAALLERDPNFLAESGKRGKIGADDAGKSRLKGAGYGGTLMEDIVDRIMAPREEARKQSNKEQRQRERRDWSVDDQKERRAYEVFVRARSRLLRASELSSPAPNGHFLREFGQSDREVIDNANDQASIPQALELLNGEVIGALGSRYSVLRRSLQDADSPGELVGIIYQAMLSRDPSAEESALLTEALSKKESNPVGIVWALLNTRQFLFIE